MTRTCTATFTPEKGKPSECVLAPDHDGPIHRDADGLEWGDQALRDPVADDSLGRKHKTLGETG